MTMTSMSGISGTIWTMWYYGIAAAPEVVKACLSSWQRHHPGWKVILIDRTNLSDYLDIEQLTGKPIERFSPLVLSDIIRINLLARYGGVWADATCYCACPLESWLPDYVQSGFFAFRRPGPDRELSSWFLAAQPDSVLIQRFRDVVNAYWKQNDLSCDRFPALYGWLTHRLARNRETTGWWFSWPIRRILKLHPYFWCHYLYTRLINQDPECRAIWNDTPDYPASIPHILQVDDGLRKPMTDRQREMIDQAWSPVFKLSWKIQPPELKPSSPIHYVIHRECRMEKANL